MKGNATQTPKPAAKKARAPSAASEGAELTPGQVAAQKAIKVAKMAMTLAKAHLARESKKHGGRWQWVEFPGPKGRESAGIVDILAIRKRWEKTGAPGDEVLKHLDVFDIMLIQVKGGGASMPTANDVARMERVAEHYRIDKILLYGWNVKKKAETGFRVLDRETHQFGPVVRDGKELFAWRNPVAVAVVQDFSFTPIPAFSARGLRRCVVPGAGTSIAMGGARLSSSVADFWQGPDGAVLVRVTWMDYQWSFRVLQHSGEAIPNRHAPLTKLADQVMQELHRWMTQDAADLPPFCDD